jgi:hypothetical protein
VNLPEVGYWLFWLFGALFMGFCLSVTWWGLFGDRAKGRRRCPRCWHDLSHTPGLTCGECGFTAAREQYLFRTRRRVTAALLAAVAAALSVATTIEHTRSSGYGSLLPTRLILMTLPLVGGSENVLVDEIMVRGSRNRLSDSQWESLIDRCISGDWRARPASKKWQSKYGPLLNTARRSAPDTLEDGLERALLDLPPWFDITSDRVWPEGTSPCLMVEYRDWWPNDVDCRIRLDPLWEGATSLIMTRNHRSVRPYPLVLEQLPPDGPAVFEAMIERRLPLDEAWTLIAERTIQVPLEIAGTIDATLEPVDDESLESLEEAMRFAFSFGVVKWPRGRSPVRVRFDPRRTQRSEFSDVAIGVSVELFQDKTLARRLDLWWLAGVRQPGNGRTGWLVDYEDETLLAEANEDDGRWRMVVRGNPSLALRAGQATKYWAGTFEQPLVVNNRRRAAPPKDWWIERVDEPGEPPL